MAKLTSPVVDISFVEKGASAINRSERGVVALVLKDKSLSGIHEVYSVATIPSGIDEKNRQYIVDALKGYQTAPKKIVVYAMDTGETEQAYTKMMNDLRDVKWDWLAIPTVETDGKAEEVASWIKSLRNNDNIKKKAVLPNTKGDSEGVVNLTSSLYKTGNVEVTPEESAPRIAGLICGTPLTISATYAPLNDYADCTRLTKEAADTAVGNGELVYIYDGEKVKLNRAVNSFTTTTDTKGDTFKKIKTVEIMDMIYTDIKSTCEDSYIGKYANSYDNKCLLITAIQAYFNELIRSGLIAAGSVDIDIDAQRNYLQSKGTKVEDLTDQDIKEANTGSHVFLTASVSILDAMEDIKLEINI